MARERECGSSGDDRTAGRAAAGPERRCGMRMWQGLCVGAGLAGPAAGCVSATVAEVRDWQEEEVEGKWVMMQGYFVRQTDDDEYVFADDTGRVRIEYEKGRLPMGRHIRVTACIDEDDVEVSSWKDLSGKRGGWGRGRVYDDRTDRYRDAGDDREYDEDDDDEWEDDDVDD
jgi:hypothetical protein